MQLLRQRQDQWSQVEFDIALQGQYPHIVGVAFKSKNYVAPPPPRVPAAPAAPKKEAAPKPVKPNKGFA